MTNSRRTIGKLAAEAGVGVETIRYYERRGLLQQPPRHGAARNYGDEALWRLRYIKVGQQWGLSLREMRDLLAGARHAAARVLLVAQKPSKKTETRNRPVIRGRWYRGLQKYFDRTSSHCVTHCFTSV
jgi:MerR family mercuric resistance operon transcriptional regulator